MKHCNMDTSTPLERPTGRHGPPSAPEDQWWTQDDVWLLKTNQLRLVDYKSSQNQTEEIYPGRPMEKPAKKTNGYIFG